MGAKLPKKWVKKCNSWHWGLVGVVAVVVGVLVCLQLYRLLSKEGPSIKQPRVLVTRRALSAGYPVNFLDLSFKIQKTVPSGALTDQDLYLLKGATLRVSLKEGVALNLDQLNLSPSVAGLGRSIPKGKRAYYIRASNPLQLNPGDSIDLLLSPFGGAQPFLLLENALVLQARIYEQENQVVAAVSPKDIAILEKAQEMGKLTLVLRNPHDRSSSKMRRIKPKSRKIRKKPVEIIIEGGDD